MKILVTGAFGNLGSCTVERLLKGGHEITCLDIKTKKNLKISKRFKGIDTIWSDVRDKDLMKEAVRGKDAVVHLAFLIPPSSETDPEMAWDINVEGTKNIINAIKQSQKDTKMVFASSISVYGISASKPPRTSSDPVQPTDSYSHHKVVCEHLIKISKIRYSILRLGAILSVDLCELDPMLFQVPLDNRIEIVHVDDAATAFANAALDEAATGKTLLIGGGKDCQMLQKDFVKKVLDVVGIGMLPENAFSAGSFYTDWMDTALSQSILKYQEKVLDDYLTDIKKALGIKRYFVRMFQPFAKYILVKKSPFVYARKTITEVKAQGIKKQGLGLK